ncbi:DsbC family protein [Halofilum ochraceum]|uniref:DsbC family protein n=1 Tax=Halofilum ochraceum TaxID=1611323 RepID=UPI001586D118|nr:DsbC family protein [Halofilum ochraceum]
MPLKTTLFAAVCLLAMVPIACTAEENAGDGGSGTSTSSGSDASAAAEEGGGDNADAKERLRARLKEARPQLDIESVRDTPVSDIYEVVSGGGVYYVSADARYLFSGDLINLEEGRNLTDDRRAEIAHDVVSEMDRSDLVVFEPANGPAENHLTVFTDHTCPYCQRLHEEVLQMVQDHPVEVRYAMYPRAGTSSSAADTLRDIWCADDPAGAMTAAKEGRSVPSRESDCSTPLDAHMQAAKAIGVRGTPYIVVGDDGPIVPGYRPRKQLLSMMGISE